MNGSNGIVPTVDLATNTSYPFMGGYGNGGFFGGDGIWAIVLLALLFGNNGWGNGFGGGFNNVATTDYISSEFTQRDVNNGFQNQSNLISNGFTNTAQDICNLRSDVLENRYAAQLSACNTQRDILSQTNELNTNLLTTQLNAQAQMDKCCCDLKAQGIENTQKILDAMNQNTIDGLRSEVNDLKNTITANGIGTSIVNQVRPYPIPAYPVTSPYTGFYGYNGGFYGNGFYGNTIV
jgi:hypothetical protein